MCLIAFAWNPQSPTPLLLAANRDEFYDRPAHPLHLWNDAPHVLAGRDLEAGGTWLGISAEGRFAALTNIRDPQLPVGVRSRGNLPLDFLNTPLSIEEHLQQLATQSTLYQGFNLLLGDHQQLWHFNSQSGQYQQLSTGVYGLSNADLDTPWPKLTRSREQLRALNGQANTEDLWAIMADTTRPTDAELPNTGIGLSGERLLSSAFIASTSYGTRASTAVRVYADGNFEISERCFGPHGVVISETTLCKP